MSNSSNVPVHVGFLARDFLSWSGGVWFIQNLLRGLASLPADRVTLTVLVPANRPVRAALRRLLRRAAHAITGQKGAYIAPMAFAAERALWTRGVAGLKKVVPRVVMYDGSERDLSRRCREHGIEALIPAMTPLRHSPLPWVGYLYDCQHRRRPDFFSPPEIAARDASFSSMLASAPVVFANARDVVADLKYFYPKHKAKLLALPFAPMIGEEELSEALAGIVAARQRVSGGAEYFIVCNQFWIHKDHATALRGFANFLADSVLRRRIKLVCTGFTDDYRFPHHFQELQTLVESLGLGDQVVFTGFLDRTEQQSLICGAIALIQPTLFEGGPGGGAASDAIALGVPCILSDIAVNRELTHPLATFFRCGDPVSLSMAMARVASAEAPRQSALELVEASEQRAHQLGEALIGAVHASRATALVHSSC